MLKAGIFNGGLYDAMAASIELSIMGSMILNGGLKQFSGQSKG